MGCSRIRLHLSKVEGEDRELRTGSEAYISCCTPVAVTSLSQSFLTCAQLFSKCAEKLSRLSESCRNGRCSILKVFFFSLSSTSKHTK